MTNSTDLAIQGNLSSARQAVGTVERGAEHCGRRLILRLNLK